MTRDEFDTYCKGLHGTTHVVQWRGSSVWKIGGKIFAIFGYQSLKKGEVRKPGDNGDRLRFKCSNLAFEILRDMPGIIPAPHLARAKWVQLNRLAHPHAAMSDEDIRLHLDAAYEIIARKLPKWQQKELYLTFS